MPTACQFKVTSRRTKQLALFLNFNFRKSWTVHCKSTLDWKINNRFQSHETKTIYIETSITIIYDQLQDELWKL